MTHSILWIKNCQVSLLAPAALLLVLYFFELTIFLNASFGFSLLKIILDNALSICGGFLCWNMLRPKVTPIAPACIAPSHISNMSSSVVAFGPPAITTGTGHVLTTFLKESLSPV